MEHKNLSLEYDYDLINKILDNYDTRYIILFLYVARNDLFQDFTDENIIKSYERVLILDLIYKGNIQSFWDESFTEVAIDLGLFKNIRSIREFEQKDEVFLVKMGEETITIEDNTMLVPSDTLFMMINKKFDFLSRRNYNLALTRLKGVKCEKTGTIHPFIYEIGQHDYMLADDLYYILDQYGNIYQTLKIEHTIESFYDRFNEILTKINDYIDTFDPLLNSRSVVEKIKKAIKEEKEIYKYLREEKVTLPDKFKFKKIDQSDQTFKKWKSTVDQLLMWRNDLFLIDNKLLELKSYYSGKDKKYNYLEFIEKVSFNEDNIVNIIQDKLIDLREEIIKINTKASKLTKKELKLLNLDYERLVILSIEED